MWNKIKHTFIDLDIILGSNWFGMEYASKKQNPELKVCHTHHGHINPQYWTQPPFKLNLIAISQWMVKAYREQAGLEARHCYNGVDMDLYPYKESHGDRLMFLGRIDPIKAPDIAIDVAERLKKQIDIVGGTRFVSDLDYVERVKAKCRQSEYANFVGEVDHATKVRYLQNASTLIIPSKFGEPFGLICVEAMATGCVPIAFNDGALGEIIVNGETGFICDTSNELIDAVEKSTTISSSACRKRAEGFSKEVCAKSYEYRFKQILGGDEW